MANKFHQFDLSMADNEDWLRYKNELRDIDFEAFTQDMNYVIYLKKLLKKCLRRRKSSKIKTKMKKKKMKEGMNLKMKIRFSCNKTPDEKKNSLIGLISLITETLRLTKGLRMKEELLSVQGEKIEGRE